MSCGSSAVEFDSITLVLKACKAFAGQVTLLMLCLVPGRGNSEMDTGCSMQFMKGIVEWW